MYSRCYCHFLSFLNTIVHACIKAEETKLRRIFLFNSTPSNYKDTQNLIDMAFRPACLRSSVRKVLKNRKERKNRLYCIVLRHHSTATVYLNFVYERSNRPISSD